MRVGILTFHMAHNYGAMLQAYALCRTVRSLGVKCEVIDYRLPEIYEYYRKENLEDAIIKNGYLIGLLKFIKWHITGYYRRDKRWLLFHRFMTNDIGISGKCLSKKEDLLKLDYDAYICGSDQIWNKDLTGGIKGEYYCDFAKESALKISYAASRGVNFLTDDEKNEILKLLSNFDFISVREAEFQKYLSENTDLDVRLVLDPSLLITCEDWKQIAKPSKLNDYVLIYKVEKNDLIYELARRIAKEKRLEIVEITYQNDTSLIDVIQLENVGPKEFVGLIESAEFVITNSFHGTGFSILFNKDFYCIPHSKFRSRTDSLLSELGLGSRCITDAEKYNVNEHIDYTVAYKKLNDLRKISIKFLKNALFNREQ
ncbi:MAG: polysaccharide pyruvyl transferase family protein [Bacillota bacterium]|nr:polysaccharide pyruvyl transferase family protein [Bacillota bacterium]